MIHYVNEGLQETFTGRLCAVVEVLKYFLSARELQPPCIYKEEIDRGD
jgi:hypothetical protein